MFTFSSLVVSDTEIATVRLPSADANIRPATNAYVSAWFVYDGSVFEVVRIDGNAAICKEPDNGITDNPLELPLPLVSDFAYSLHVKIMLQSMTPVISLYFHLIRV
jgi:hypothetical protein